ncbi:unnamed protein product (macronuclear) [Paramecium tetraurelia]|uniref:Cyclic nucleotide-binding domain-containing protein n=1 Tax=Paramecium tetraurelia TaxID=5888 RepID=A0BXC3_PARTE|nr:uncharacterized protein GSPATT00033043001 [Paramecium tetraurelia]CAK63190.1 unnamed protein product [Paramecium tetraurelia]|eukprot:XP_001430588.1 hypothetical protein (macronuclear) [Paramecium tetraurelia strain d4-2]
MYLFMLYDFKSNRFYNQLLKISNIFRKSKKNAVSMLYKDVYSESNWKFIQKYLNEKQCKQDTIVFEKGDRGRDFYIILSGQVGIYIFSNNMEQLQHNKINIRQGIRECVNQLIGEGVGPNKDQTPEIRRILLNEKIKKLLKVNELHEGDSFGERALINETGRLATVVCEKQCYFAVLNKQAYKEILQQAQSEKIQQQIKGLQSISTFQGMSRRLLTILLYAFQSQEYKFRDLIYKEGQLNKEEIYLILSGEFIVTEKLTYYLNQQQLNQTREIAILQKGCIFGDKETFQHLKQRTQTIRCNSDYGKVLCIQLESLVQRLLVILSLNQANNELHLINELKNLSDLKETHRQNRIQKKIQSPERSRSVIKSNSPFQRIDQIVKQKKELFNQLNQNGKTKIQFIYDINIPTQRKQNSCSMEFSKQKRRSIIDRVMLNSSNNSRFGKRQSLDQNISTQFKQIEKKRYSII